MARAKPPPQEPPQDKKGGGPRVARYGIAFATGILLTVGGIFLHTRLEASTPEPASTARRLPATNYRSSRLISSYQDLLARSPSELAGMDFALMNLLCAKGLPGAENLDIPSILEKLDSWAETVRYETERHLYRVHNPQYAEHYRHSEARLRAEFIVQVLQEDCGVHYNIERIRDVDFGNSQDTFIHGMVASDNGGTCASLPVLYMAVGRRLGYPMKLVLAREHLFVRWEDGKERFNIEGAGNGGIDYPDDSFYRTWPHPITDKMMASGEFLKSLTPSEELSVFMLNRGVCLHEHRRFPEAAEAYAASHRLMPNAISPRLALLTAADGLPLPNRERDQLLADTLEMLNMQREAFSRFQRRGSDDPTPRIPMPGQVPGVPTPAQKRP